MNRNLAIGLCSFALFSSAPLARADSFSVDQARAQAVVIRPDEYLPQVLVGYDEKGQLVWYSDPAGTRGLRHDEEGRTVEEVDEFANRVETIYPSQPMIIEQRFRWNRAGAWSQRTLSDTEGQPLVTTVDSGISDWSGPLLQLGLSIEDETAAPSVEQAESADGLEEAIANPFSRATSWYRKGAKSALGVRSWQT